MIIQSVRLPKVSGLQVYAIEGFSGQVKFVIANTYLEAEKKAKETFGWASCSAYETIEVTI